MYGHRAGDSVLTHLAAVNISPMRGFLGVAMYNHLRDSLTPGGKLRAPRYQLNVEFTTNRAALITAKDSQVRRFNLVINANYNLLDIGSGSLLKSGVAHSATNYNVVETSNFATLVAEEAAHLRGVRQISQQIVWALSVFFKQRLSSPKKSYESIRPTS